MSFDWTTFLLELINFVVLAALLTRFVYKPISSSIQERRERLTQAQAEATQRLEDLTGRSTALDARSRELDRLREEIYASALTEAAEERARLLAQARDDAAAERERVQGLLEAEREAAEAWVKDAAIERGAQVAGQLLLSLAPEAAHAALLDRLTEEVRARGEALRDPSGAAPSEVEVSMARLPRAGEVDSLRAAVAEALGQPPRWSVKEDERIGAGAILRVGDRVLDASVSGQLELLRREARHLLAEAG